MADQGRNRRSPERIPSKIDNLKVNPGDRIVFKTAGSGGWGDPLDRAPELVARDVRYDLVSRELAERDYAVVLTEDLRVNEVATQKARTDARRVRGRTVGFRFRLHAAGAPSGGIMVTGLKPWPINSVVSGQAPAIVLR